MSSQALNKKIVRGSKWSAVTEIAVKLFTPISSMVLARLLTPEAFGVVTTLAMIITFAELFTDAGFQKYLIQHEFRDAEDCEQSTSVAFWSNLAMSLFLWGVIAIFADPLAALVGNPGLGHVLIVACVSIPLASFSSIQMALYKRDFDFKTLFKVKMVSVVIPLFVTIPLAYWLRSYWALVIGTITVNLINAILLTVYSNWRPRFFYSFAKLKDMLSFTIWTVIEQVSIWLTGYVDVFIVGMVLSQYYLGLYKTSSTLVGQIMGLIVASITPVLFSGLSRLQNDEKEFQRLFFRFQKITGLMVIPMGVGIYIFSSFVTELMLGEQWVEASGFIGLWALTSTLTIIWSNFSAEVYRAKGRPKLSVLAQWLHIVALIPVALLFVRQSFEALYIARSLVRLEIIVVNLCIMGIVLKMSARRMILTVLPTCLSAACMFLVLLLPSPEGVLMNLVYLGIASLIYLMAIMLFPEERRTLMNLPKLIRSK